MPHAIDTECLCLVCECRTRLSAADPRDPVCDACAKGMHLVRRSTLRLGERRMIRDQRQFERGNYVATA